MREPAPRSLYGELFGLPSRALVRREVVDRALRSWSTLAEATATGNPAALTEWELAIALQRELRGQRRWRMVDRIHTRLCSIRKGRERRQLMLRCD